jgi:hypothetical protein
LEKAVGQANSFSDDLNRFIAWLTDTEKTLNNLKPVSRLLCNGQFYCWRIKFGEQSLIIHEIEIYFKFKLSRKEFFFFFLHCHNRVRVMVFNTTFNNISVISWQSVLLLEESGVP